MATGVGSGSHDLSLYQSLAQRPGAHHIFLALRILEAHHADAPRLGEARRPRQDKIRLGQVPEMAFPRTTIASFEPGQGVDPDKLKNLFFGFYGPNGPLPLHLTEYARDRMRNNRDTTMVAFTDMLTHRMFSLFYRAWATAQPAPSYDRADDQMSRRVAALSGYHSEGLENRDKLPDDARRHFAGLLALEQKTAEGLVAIVSGFFDAPVNLQQFVGSWLELEPSDTWQLGKPTGLGQSASLGSRVWSRTAKFRLRIGPLSREDYDNLLPGGDALERLRSIVRTYLGDALDWDLNLVLAGQDVPRTCLDGGTRLGHTSWVRARHDSDEPAADADDLYLYPGPLAA